MHLSSAAALIAATHLGLVAAGAVNSTCRCTFGDPCWPSQRDFDQLADKLSRPLIRPVPPALACYPPVNAAACAEATARWTNGTWRADQPGALQDTTFERFIFPNGTIDACYLNTTLTGTCGQGGIPVIGVDAHTVTDVQAGVNFAREHNLRLVVKNTGHDYLGRSSGRGAFVIWTHNLKNIIVSEAFRPAGAPRDESHFAITIGGGDQWKDVYAAANDAGRAVVGGLSVDGSVGAAGGWAAGGGHSMLSPTYGLGVDNILEISVVTASGKHLTANAYQNTDLFWALRGGGGGTFGVVTGLTYLTHPITPFISVNFDVDATAPTAPALHETIDDMLRTLPTVSDGSWGGYAGIHPTSFSMFFGKPNTTQADAEAAFGPLFERARARAAASNGTFSVETKARAYPSWYAWYKQNYAGLGSDVGVSAEGGSWLLPRDALEHAADTLIPLQAQLYWIVGGAVSKVDPNALGVNPALRKAAVHALTGISYPDNTSAEELEGLRSFLRANMASLRALAPESGAYLNEASMYEPDPRHSFFGSHYGKLKEIKRRYDPEDVFVVQQGVGAEDWDAALGCRRSVS